MTILTDSDRDYFRRHGFVLLHDLVSAAQVERFLELFDQDRKRAPLRWAQRGSQTMNCDALCTTPEFDEVIRHPLILQAVGELMGGPVCFGELCIRHMGPAETPGSGGWHRDRGHYPGHPLRMDYIQLMLYLTDVDETTHCFSLSPESVDEPILDKAGRQLERGGCFDVHGPAGTVCLFNVAVLHRATVRKTGRERKSIQVYYGHRDRPYLADDSLIPPMFFNHHPDPEVRAFYGNLNAITRLYMRAFGIEENR